MQRAPQGHMEMSALWSNMPSSDSHEAHAARAQTSSFCGVDAENHVGETVEKHATGILTAAIRA